MSDAVLIFMYMYMYIPLHLKWAVNCNIYNVPDLSLLAVFWPDSVCVPAVHLY